jgi:hypothetical protein
VIPLRTVLGGEVTGVAYVTSDARGFIRYGVEVPQCAFTYAPPLRIPSEMKPGDRYEHEGSVVARDKNRRDGTDCLSSTGRSAVTFTGVEPVTVPTGAFPGCVRLLSESVSKDEDGEVTTEKHVLYYAPTVGLVKQVVGNGEAVHELLTYVVPRARIEVTPAALDFGVLSLNKLRSQTVTIKNAGDKGSDLRGVVVAPAAPFTLTRGGGELVLRPGQTREVTIGLKVPAAGQWEGALTIRSNGGEKVVSLVGRS